jgi:hypothetical protein
MTRGNIKVIAASLTIAGAVVFLGVFLHRSPPLGDPRPHAGVGQALAEQTAKLVGSGGKITVIVRDTSVFPNPATGFELEGFVNSLRKAGLSAAATNIVKLDPLRPLRVPPGDFFDLLRKQGEGDVVVSFLGPPLLSDEQVSQFGDKKPAAVAFCPGNLPRQFDLRAGFDQGILRAVVISRPDPPVMLPESGDPAAWFAHFYKLVTRANLSELPLPPDAMSR